MERHEEFTKHANAAQQSYGSQKSCWSRLHVGEESSGWEYLSKLWQPQQIMVCAYTHIPLLCWGNWGTHSGYSNIPRYAKPANSQAKYIHINVNRDNSLARRRRRLNSYLIYSPSLKPARQATNQLSALAAAAAAVGWFGGCYCSHPKSAVFVVLLRLSH